MQKLQIKLFFFMLMFCSIQFAKGQVETQLSSGEIYEKLLKFSNLQTVMYIAAHPDDENTRLISYLSNNEHVNTVYLSLTRGDGGQNLIGTETGPQLGLLRTQELLAARKIDGGKQWFTRANDFGYSKTADETLAFWDKEKVLGDVVWAIRVHRPDVLITRFDPNSNGKTHGHHTASAMLAMEAFDLAGKSDAYPEQLKFVNIWQPSRIYQNTSWWFYGSQEAFAKVDKSNMAEIDVGTYYPILGRSNNEIAAQSRSQHRCQGFGSSASRGSHMEYLLHMKGSKPTNKNNILENATGLGKRFDYQTKDQIEKAIKNYDFTNPAAILDNLFEIKHLFDLNQMHRSADYMNQDDIDEKMPAIEELILQVAGIYIEATVDTPYTIPGGEYDVKVEIVNRGNAEVKYLQPEKDGKPYVNIGFNEKFEDLHLLKEHLNEDPSAPYWLMNEKQGELYAVENQELIGLPEVVDMATSVMFAINGEYVGVEVPIQYKRVEPDFGEIYEPFRIVPEISVALESPVYLAKDGEKVEVNAVVKAYANNAAGYITLGAPKGWQVEGEYKFDLQKTGESQTFSFTLVPQSNAQSGTVTAYTSNSLSEKYKRLIEIDYEHIPSQIVLEDASAKLQILDMEIPAIKIGYIQGAGDEVAKSLQAIGMDVTELQVNQINSNTLQQYDAVVLGIRAFNTKKDELKFVTDDLWEYVNEGGNVIVQYNTSRRLDGIAPIDLTLGRSRISEEDAKLTFLAPEHRVLNYPNKISQADFDGWVQERGLYFGETWDQQFTPILRGNDKGEDPKDGALLVAKVGEGYYTYTGLSFFRELPAGVPGAYRLFMNILALDQIDN